MTSECWALCVLGIRHEVSPNLKENTSLEEVTMSHTCREAEELGKGRAGVDMAVSKCGVQAFLL